MCDAHALRSANTQGPDDGGELVDLTHRLDLGMPVFPGHPCYRRVPVESFAKGDKASFAILEIGEHSGTHFDAPAHFLADGADIAAPPLSTFFGRMAVVRMPGMAPRGLVTGDDIRDWEARHGGIEPNDAVFFHFGWDRFFADPARHDHFLEDWPGLSAEAAGLLVRRGVRIVGTDCLSIDAFGSSDYPAHYALLGAGVLIGENFNNLGRLPPFCNAVTLPLPIAGGSGSPVRAVALVPRNARSTGEV